MKEVKMAEQRKTTAKKLSLQPPPFDVALKVLLETEPPKEKQEKKSPVKQRSGNMRNTSDKK